MTQTAPLVPTMLWWPPDWQERGLNSATGIAKYGEYVGHYDLRVSLLNVLKGSVKDRTISTALQAGLDDTNTHDVWLLCLASEPPFKFTPGNLFTKRGVYRVLERLGLKIPDTLLQFWDVCQPPLHKPHYMDAIGYALQSLAPSTPATINGHTCDYYVPELGICIIDRANIAYSVESHVAELSVLTGLTCVVVDAANAANVAVDVACKYHDYIAKM